MSHARAVRLAQAAHRRADQRVVEAVGAVAQTVGSHDPHKIFTDLAIALAVGGDCLANVALLRAEPGVYGNVASAGVTADQELGC